MAEHVPSYAVAYLENLQLPPGQGSDLPLDPRYRRVHGEWVKKLIMGPIMSGTISPTRARALMKLNHEDELQKGFDQSKEDYWLFDVRGKNILILVEESPMAPNGSSVAQIQRPGPTWAKSEYQWYAINDKVKAGSNLFHDFYESKEDRYVAIRCAKMTNPIITIVGSTSDSAIRSVGLFLGNVTGNKNEFICVKTTNRLLPSYAARNKHREGYDLDGPVDIACRTLTIHPKQLIGTAGHNTSLYARYVTCDPTKPKVPFSDFVFDPMGGVVTIFKPLPPWLPKDPHWWVWNKDSDTKIESWDLIYLAPPKQHISDFVTGKQIAPKDANGLELMMAMGKTTLGAITCAISGNFAGAIAQIIESPHELETALRNNSLQGGANAKGLLKAIVDFGDTTHSKYKAASKKEKERQSEKALKELKSVRVDLDVYGVEMTHL